MQQTECENFLYHAVKHFNNYSSPAVSNKDVKKMYKA